MAFTVLLILMHKNGIDLCMVFYIKSSIIRSNMLILVYALSMLDIPAYRLQAVFTVLISISVLISFCRIYRGVLGNSGNFYLCKSYSFGVFCFCRPNAQSKIYTLLLT